MIYFYAIKICLQGCVIYRIPKNSILALNSSPTAQEWNRVLRKSWSWTWSPLRWWL